MSAWEHTICEACWDARCIERDQAGRKAVRIKDMEFELCCWCGKSTNFAKVRDSPTAVPCGGEHGPDEDA